MFKEGKKEKKLKGIFNTFVLALLFAASTSAAAAASDVSN